MNNETLIVVPKPVRLAVARGLLAMLTHQADEAAAERERNQEDGRAPKRDGKHQTFAHAASPKVSL
jgi:hypothetical protein